MKKIQPQLEKKLPRVDTEEVDGASQDAKQRSQSNQPRIKKDAIVISEDDLHTLGNTQQLHSLLISPTNGSQVATSQSAQKQREIQNARRDNVQNQPTKQLFVPRSTQSNHSSQGFSMSQQQLGADIVEEEDEAHNLTDDPNEEAELTQGHKQLTDAGVDFDITPPRRNVLDKDPSDYEKALSPSQQSKEEAVDSSMYTSSQVFRPLIMNVDGRNASVAEDPNSGEYHLAHTQTAQPDRLMDLAASANNMLLAEKNVASHLAGEITISPSVKATNDQSESDIQHIIALRKRSMMKKMRLKSQSQQLDHFPKKIAVRNSFGQPSADVSPNPYGVDGTADRNAVISQFKNEKQLDLSNLSKMQSSNDIAKGKSSVLQKPIITVTDDKEQAERLEVFDSVEEIISSDSLSNSSGEEDEFAKSKEVLLKSKSFKSKPTRKMSSKMKLELQQPRSNSMSKELEQKKRAGTLTMNQLSKMLSHVERKGQMLDDCKSSTSKGDKNKNRVGRKLTTVKDLLKRQHLNYDDGFVNINDAEQLKAGAAARFYHYRSHFRDLTDMTYIDTSFDIVTIHIAPDSKNVIVLIQISEEKYVVRFYNMEANTLSQLSSVDEPPMPQQLMIEGTYVKAKEVNQDRNGRMFNIPYIDDGVFWVMIFDLNKEIVRINVNNLLQIDDSTTTIYGQNDPFINVTFISSARIFINLFHKKSMSHYHLIYDFKRMKVRGQPVQIKLTCSELNYPHDNFYDQNRQLIYIFYRQGQSFTIDAKDPSRFKFQTMSDDELGQMHLIFNQVLVVRSSRRILFFKIEENKQNDGDSLYQCIFWRLYHSVDLKGFVFYSKSRQNARIQVTTDRLIYFYKLNADTLEPVLENCMYNNMGCSQLMFAPARNFCLTYKYGQVGLNIYRRKYIHSFIVNLNREDYHHSFSKVINSIDKYVIAKNSQLTIYDQNTFMPVNTIDVPFKQHIICNDHLEDKNSQRMNRVQRIEILQVQISDDEEKIAVLVGQQLEKHDHCLSYFLYIYQWKEKRWNLKHSKALPVQLRYISKHFEFGKNTNELLVTTQRKIMRYNYWQNTLRDVYIFKDCLNSQPIHVVFDEDQKIAMVSSFYDIIYVNMEKGIEIDIDEHYNLANIRRIVRGKDCFYVLANKYKNTLGFYLIQIDKNNPKMKPEYLINWKNKLDVSDVTMFHVAVDHVEDQLRKLRQQDILNMDQIKRKGTAGSESLSRGQTIFEMQNSKKQNKISGGFLIVSLKSIYINTFGLFVIDLQSKQVIFRHESYHLWEANIQGLLLKNYDFLILSDKGKQIMSLGNKMKRKITDNKGANWKLHSLSSFKDLKLERCNTLLFQNFDGEMVIRVQQQFKGGSGNTIFEDIYKIKLDVMNLRELLLAQSILACRHQSDIVNLIDYQADPCVFYKSFLEFEKNNLVSILSYDSRSIRKLLHEKNEAHFPVEYPLFYMTRALCQSDALQAAAEAHSDNDSQGDDSISRKRSEEDKPDQIERDAEQQDLEQINVMKSAIDTALENNQLRAINLIIDYLVKHQNSYVYFFLFRENFIKLLRKGSINISALLNSNIFYHQFDFMGWPSIHEDDSTILAPYNNSLFQLRNQYQFIFADNPALCICHSPDDDEADICHSDENEEYEDVQVFQISYTLNMLPAVLQMDQGDSIMEVCGFVDDLSMFECDALQDFIQFKWDSHAGIVHYVGLSSHILYFILLSVYINLVYVYQMLEDSRYLLLPMGILLLYPMFYDMTQLIRQGWSEYLQDKWNLFDQCHIWIGIGNLILHACSNPLDNLGQVGSLVILMLCLFKTFFFLRVFKSLSQMVTMLGQVTQDLTSFLTFYIILIWLAGLVYNVIGMASLDNTDETLSELKRSKSRTTSYPGVEYKHLPYWIRQPIASMRISLGDFDFSESAMLDEAPNFIYWVIWILIVYLTSIVFLNFIIAEVSDSYAQVQAEVNNLFLQERTRLIKESEDMLPKFYKDMHEKYFFPKYIIKRQAQS